LNFFALARTDNECDSSERRSMAKEAMVKKSGDMTFWPVTLKHADQLELEAG
jgi:hypothetical protein